MNLVVLGGNLTRDPDLQTTTSGQTVVNGCVALNRRFKTADGAAREEVLFVEFSIWGARGEAFARFHKKGSRVLLTGRLVENTWNDKATGEKRSRMKVTVDEWEFAASRGDSDAGRAPDSGKSEASSSGAKTPDDDAPF